MKITYRGYIYESYGVADIDRIYGKQLGQYLINNMQDLFWETVPVKQGREENEKIAKKMFIDKIYKTDPSSDKKYLGAITQWIMTKRPEDLDSQIKPYLEKFKKLLDLNPGKFGNISKSISKGKITLDQLKDVVNSNSDLLGKNKANLKLEDKVGDFPIVGENEKYVCYLVDKWVGEDRGKSVEQISSENGQEKHFCFNGDVDWCVKYRSHFDAYNPPYYYFLERETGKEFALMHIESLQLKDIRDNTLNKNNFLLIKDIVVNILSGKLMPYIGVDYGESDFSVVVDNISPEEFNKVFHNVVGDLLLNAINTIDYSMINSLFNTYSASELYKKTIDISSESDILTETKWLGKNSGHILYKLSDTALKGLFDEFGLDEETIFKEMCSVPNTINDLEENSKINVEYDRKNEIAKWMVEDEYVSPNWTINYQHEDLTPLEFAVMGKNIGAVTALLKNEETNPNTTGLDSAHKSYGVTPLYYIANLTDYERDHIFNLLVNDPRVDVNAYVEEFDKNTNTYYGKSVLDVAIEDRKPILITKGAKPYNQLTNTLKVSASKYR